MEARISPEVAAAAPQLKEIIIEADVKNPPTSDELWAEITRAASELKASLPMEMVNKRPAIAATRAAYKALGKEPNRYRPSAEALSRRCVKGLELYRTLTIIDLINLVSIVTGHSIGAFDRDAVVGDVVELGVGREGEPYEAIGRGQLNIACLPVFRDAVGGIGTPTSDNDRTKLTEHTRRLLVTLNIYGSGDVSDEETVALIRRLLEKYASATNFRIHEFTAESRIAKEIRRIHQSLPQGVRLVAVSKFHPADAIAEAYSAGQRIFGESRVQELLEKIPQLPDDIKWHFIGHLQTNKVKQLIGRVALIESVDSIRLLDLIDRMSDERHVTTDVLLQVHVAQEDTKFGFSPDEILEYFRRRGFDTLKATRICGLMGMASNTDDTDRIRADFRAIADLRQQILDMCPDLSGFDILSMGMSEDYPIAIEEGATLVRVGTAIFGERN